MGRERSLSQVHWNDGGQPRGQAQPSTLGRWQRRLHTCLSGTMFMGSQGGAAGRAEKQKLDSVKAPLSLGSWRSPLWF